MPTKSTTSSSATPWAIIWSATALHDFRTKQLGVKREVLSALRTLQQHGPSSAFESRKAESCVGPLDDEEHNKKQSTNNQSHGTPATTLGREDAARACLHTINVCRTAGGLRPRYLYLVYSVGIDARTGTQVLFLLGFVSGEKAREGLVKQEVSYLVHRFSAEYLADCARRQISELHGGAGREQSTVRPICVGEKYRTVGSARGKPRENDPAPGAGQEQEGAGVQQPQRDFCARRFYEVNLDGLVDDHSDHVVEGWTVDEVGEEVEVEEGDEEEDIYPQFARASSSAGGQAQTLSHFPLFLDAEEHELILQPGPVLIQGRSGTGKTTVLERRALAYEEAFWDRELGRERAGLSARFQTEFRPVS